MEDRTELTFIYVLVDLNNTDNFCHHHFVITNSVTTKSVVSSNLCTPTASFLHLIILTGSGC